MGTGSAKTRRLYKGRKRLVPLERIIHVDQERLQNLEPHYP